MKKITLILAVLVSLAITSMSYAQDYQLQICWGPNITDSGWKDISSTCTVADGTAVANQCSGKLGVRSSEFQLNESQKIVAKYSINALPCNLAYNLQNSKIKIYTNWYWVRCKAVGATTWSEPSNWVAITYMK